MWLNRASRKRLHDKFPFVGMDGETNKSMLMEAIMDKKTMIEKLVRDAHEKAGFTGTWLYAEKGEIVSSGAIGINDLEKGTPISEDMVFDLASVTKQFTAAAVMLLKRRGLLSLDDEITKFFPGLPFPGVTVRNLLTHTGGLPDYEEWIERPSSRPAKNGSTATPVTAFLRRSLRRSPACLLRNSWSRTYSSPRA